MHNVLFMKLSEPDYNLSDHGASVFLSHPIIIVLRRCLQEHATTYELRDKIEPSFTHVEIVKLAMGEVPVV